MSVQEKVERYMNRRGSRGATDYEIRTDLNIPLGTANAARFSLYKGRKVKKSSAKRPTNTGTPATVWVARGF